jgi:hypothetical protein
MKMNQGAFGVLFSVTVLLFATVANAQDLVVVEAAGIEMAPGDRVGSSVLLDLSEGQHLTLISTAGVILTIDGPYEGSPAGVQVEGTDFASRLRNLLVEDDGRNDIGATRAGQLAPLPEPWLFDVSHTGNVCLLDGSTPVLWRASSNANSDFAVTSVDHTWRAQLRWPAGLDRITADTGLPIRAGATYLMILDGEQSALAVKSVPSTLDNDLMRVAWMVEMGCEAQAQALMRLL